MSSYPWAVEYDWSLAQSTIGEVITLLPLAAPISSGGVRGELSSYR